MNIVCPKKKKKLIRGSSFESEIRKKLNTEEAYIKTQIKKQENKPKQTVTDLTEKNVNTQKNWYHETGMQLKIINRQKKLNIIFWSYRTNIYEFKRLF